MIYLLARLIPRYTEVSQREYLVNAIDMIKESAISDFDVEDEKRAREYLKKSDPNDHVVQAAKRLLAKIEGAPSSPPNLFTKCRVVLRTWYYRVARSGVVLNVVIIFLVAQTVRLFLQSASVFVLKPSLPFYEWGQLFSSCLAGVFILMGFLILRFSKAEAYRFFRIAMLITILLTEFFAFMKFQWYELIGLTANLFILGVINYAMAMERVRVKQLDLKMSNKV